MKKIICKTEDHEVVIDMALEKEITVDGVHMVLIGDGRCAAFIVGGAGPVIVGHSWKKLGCCCLKVAA